jgi:hypothetical protein
MLEMRCAHLGLDVALRARRVLHGDAAPLKPGLLRFPSETA